MYIKIQQSENRLVKDNFYYLQLVDTIIPLIFSFIVAVVFFGVIMEQSKGVLSNADDTVLLLGIASSLLCIGLVLRIIDLFFKSETRITVDLQQNTITKGRRKIDLTKATVLYKFREYRPIKIFHLFFTDVDMVQMRITDKKEYMQIEMNTQAFNLIKEKITAFPHVQLQSFDFLQSHLAILSQIVSTVSIILLIALSFFYFIVR